MLSLSQRLFVLLPQIPEIPYHARENIYLGACERETTLLPSLQSEVPRRVLKSFFLFLFIYFPPCGCWLPRTPYASSFPHARDHLTQTRSRVAT